MEIKYTITQNQLDSLGYYKDMFDTMSESIAKLCDSEKDDIVYGFELGQIYGRLRKYFVGMIELEDEIISQKIQP